VLVSLSTGKVCLFIIIIIIRNEYYYSAVSLKKLREHVTVKNI